MTDPAGEAVLIAGAIESAIEAFLVHVDHVDGDICKGMNAAIVAWCETVSAKLGPKLNRKGITIRDWLDEQAAALRQGETE